MSYLCRTNLLSLKAVNLIIVDERGFFNKGSGTMIWWDWIMYIFWCVVYVWLRVWVWCVCLVCVMYAHNHSKVYLKLKHTTYPESRKGLRDMACSETLASGNHFYIYPRTQPRWTSLHFCRKCTKRENPRWPPQMSCLYSSWKVCPNLMCDISFPMVFCMPSPFLATFPYFVPYLGCLF